MRTVLAVLLGILLAAPASGSPVQIGGQTYHTGLFRRPLVLAPAPYKIPVFESQDLPEEYDARDDGLVSPIKNQGSCGSCWAFSRTKSMEAQLRILGIETDLSEQDTLVNDKNSYGCNGGFMDGRFEVKYGQTDEASCTYRGSHRYRCNGAKVAKATKWAMLGAPRRAPTVDELRAAIVEYGVISVTVAAGRSFSPNRDGRITTCGSRGLNHMVNLAGYRPAPSGGYEFLIANSWGKGWGEEGFAWSKQGCNQLASVAGDAALFFYIEE